ncbi:hypothetical protein BDV19DRAFT_387548 [Aspergillus venezuelensis]
MLARALCSLAVCASTVLAAAHDHTRRAPVAGGAKLRVLPLGDSITHGYLSTGDNGYRQRLWERLSENEKDFVGTQPIGTMSDPDNEGYNGAVIGEISDRCGTALAMRPNVVLIHAGTNDMNRPFEPDTAPERLGSLIDKVVDACPDAAVLVAKLIPAAGVNTMGRIEAFNKAVPGVVASRAEDGKKVMVVEMDALSVSELVDGLHPTDAGYDHMGDIWYSSIIAAGNNGWIEDPVPGTSTGASCATLPVWYPQDQIAAGIGSSTGFVNAWMPKGEIASGIGKGSNLRFGDLDGDGRDDYLWVHDTGAVTAYLNTVGANADEVAWVPQGDIASGIGKDGAGVQFADMNGDGRDDYLWVSEEGQVICYLNQPGSNRGQPSWMPVGEIAAGVGASRGQILFGDVDGDGRDDYLVVSDNGAINAWLNTGSGDKPIWIPVGQIASGVGAAAGVRIADVNKDGRDDYLWISDTGAVTLYTNTRGASGELPVWWPQGEIATGVGVGRENITFADLNGDGQSDYLVIGPNGEVSEWQNNGAGGVSQIGPGVQFHDLDGDGKDDYLSVDDQGRVIAYVNGGYSNNKQIWYPQGEIASGVGATRGQVRFADLDGDGRVEYLHVHDNGAVDSWRNVGAADPAFPGVVTWVPQGQIASGIGKDGEGVRFADLNGDGQAEYLHVAANGAVIAYLNGGGDPGHPTWIPQGTIATGVGGAGKDVRFADINGDGRADYLWLKPDDGSVECWINAGSPDGNSGPNAAKVVWIPWGTIASGVGTDGSRIRFGDLNGDKRADYIAITSDDTGAASEWLNGCSVEEGEDPGDNDPVEPPGTIKQPDEFCAVLGDDGSDTKSVENWLEWDIDTALTNFIDQFQPNGAKGPFRTDIQDSLLSFYDEDVLDQISYKCNPPANCDLSSISQEMCADQPELTFIFWAIQNFNNFCVDMAQSIVNSGSILTAKAAKLADTFGQDFDEDSPLSSDFAFANGLLTVISGFGFLSWAAIPAGFAGIGGAMLGYAAGGLTEPKFDNFADISDKLGDMVKELATNIEDLAVSVLEDTPVNNPDEEEFYANNPEGLVQILQGGGFAEPIDVPILPNRILRSLTSPMINELWREQKPWIAHTTKQQAGFDPCDSPSDQFKDNVWCSGDDAYILFNWEDDWFNKGGSFSIPPDVSGLLELQGVGSLQDYDLSLELVVQSSAGWQSRLGEFQPEITMDRSYEYLINVVGRGGTLFDGFIEDWQLVTFNIPVCDLEVLENEDEERIWPPEDYEWFRCFEEDWLWCKIAWFGRAYCHALLFDEDNKWPYDRGDGF